MNDQFVNISNLTDLAIYLSELARQNVTYSVTKETDNSWSVLITGF
jgi:hypothetical protein